MVVKAVSGGSSLAVLAAPDCDTDLVAYEMTLLVGGGRRHPHPRHPYLALFSALVTMPRARSA